MLIVIGRVRRPARIGEDCLTRRTVVVIREESHSQISARWTKPAADHR